jgi:predicted DNA-binding protein YlxM (UPF0122 family)
MSNQYTISRDKEISVLLAWFIYDWSQKEIARHYRLSKKIVKGIIKKSYEDYNKLLLERNEKA